MGSGLNLAMTLFDNSPRRLYGNKPQNIVIAVTDGEDNSGYPAKTKAAADKLKADPYDAFLMTIGVGRGCTSTAAVNTLKSLASSVGGQPAYFHVTDYSQIKSYVDKVFSPLCEQFHSECGLDCKGFCGCGECLCPFCDVTGSKCQDYRCVSRAGTSNGCVMTPLVDCGTDDLCVQHKCLDSNNQATCKDELTCQDYIDKNEGSCRRVSCNVNNGKCTVTRDDTVCKKFNNPCETWGCAGVNETAMDPATGCKIVVNKTAQCQGTASCLAYSCDVNTGQCITEDLCTARNHKCSTFTCDTTINDCVEHPISGPANTSCTTYKCDVTSGWYASYTKTPEECSRLLNDTDVCKVFRCDVNLEDGCTYDVIKSCGPKCNDHVASCKATANRTSTREQCLTGFCYVKDVSGETVPDCDYNVTNCFESEAFANATAMNAANPNVCYTVECSNGGCVLSKIDKPTEPGKNDTACWTNVCVPDEVLGFRWERQPSKNMTDSISDECFNRVCDDVFGVNETDVCTNRTTECKVYACNRSGGIGKGKCEYTLTPLRDLDCYYEECPDDKMIRIYKNLSVVCPTEYKCLIPTCTEDGQCKFEHAKPPEGVFTEDQLDCVVCDNATGIFSYYCDDGQFCTNDLCAADKTCHYTPVDCYTELNMSTKNPKDFCFLPDCAEKPTKYQCKRKKKPGTFIDMCGRCVDENGEPFEKDDSSDDLCALSEDDVVLKEPLAAATIAMIVLGAILIGAAITMSSILGTKALLERAKQANNQSAHSNPLFEDNGKEMANPTFMEEVDVEE